MVRHCSCPRDEGLLETFQMLDEMTSSENMEFLISYGPWLLTDCVPLSLSFILQPLCHLIQNISEFFLIMRQAGNCCYPHFIDKETERYTVIQLIIGRVRNNSRCLGVCPLSFLTNSCSFDKSTHSLEESNKLINQLCKIEKLQGHSHADQKHPSQNKKHQRTRRGKAE